MLSAVADGYLLHAEKRTMEEQKTWYALLESGGGEETLLCHVWFSGDGLPLYGEIEKNGRILAAMGFTNVKIHETITDT